MLQLDLRLGILRSLWMFLPLSFGFCCNLHLMSCVLLLALLDLYLLSFGITFPLVPSLYPISFDAHSDFSSVSGWSSDGF